MSDLGSTTSVVTISILMAVLKKGKSITIWEVITAILQFQRMDSEPSISDRPIVFLDPETTGILCVHTNNGKVQ